jgi:hypothetical protein
MDVSNDNFIFFLLIFGKERTSTNEIRAQFIVLQKMIQE